MKRTITLILMAFMTITMTFAQRSKGESVVPGSVSPYGADWEAYNMDGKSYNYFKGNARVDTIKVENMLGKHWKGNEVDIIGDQEIYLCNVATGEYLLVGDYWGETSMTNHVGLSYKLLPGTSTRRSGWGEYSLTWAAEHIGFSQQVCAKSALSDEHQRTMVKRDILSTTAIFSCATK